MNICARYVNITCWVHVCSLCVYGFRDGHFVLDSQLGPTWTEANSPSLGRHYLPVVLCQRLGPQGIFPLPHQHGCSYCLCSGPVCVVFSTRDCFTAEIRVFWRLQSSQPRSPATTKFPKPWTQSCDVDISTEAGFPYNPWCHFYCPLYWKFLSPPVGTHLEPQHGCHPELSCPPFLVSFTFSLPISHFSPSVC